MQIESKPERILKIKIYTMLITQNVYVLLLYESFIGTCAATIQILGWTVSAHELSPAPYVEKREGNKVPRSRAAFCAFVLSLLRWQYAPSSSKNAESSTISQIRLDKRGSLDFCR